MNHLLIMHIVYSEYVCMYACMGYVFMHVWQTLVHACMYVYVVVMSYEVMNSSSCYTRFGIGSWNLAPCKTGTVRFWLSGSLKQCSGKKLAAVVQLQIEAKNAATDRPTIAARK